MPTFILVDWVEVNHAIMTFAGYFMQIKGAIHLFSVSIYRHLQRKR